MKRLILCLMALGLAVVSMAGDYTLTLTSYSVTEPETAAGVKTPSIAGPIKIDQIQIYGTCATYDEQVIEIYDLGSSTRTAVISQRYVIRVGSSTGVNVEPVIVNYPYSNPLTLSNPYIKKTNTTSTIYVNIQGR
jgi:hypothetical protein